MRNKQTIKRSRAVEDISEVMAIAAEMNKLLNRIYVRGQEANRILEGIPGRYEMGNDSAA